MTRHGLSGGDYQDTFDELVADGYRPVDVSGYAIGGEDAYAAIFIKTDGRGWAARHGLHADDYQAAFDELGGECLKLRSISGYNVGGEATFAAVWEEPGVDLIGLDLADSIAQKAMDAAGIAGMSIAIAKDGELVYARAFGLADPDAGEATRPDHRFRIASVSKPITAVAIMGLIESSSQGISPSMTSSSGTTASWGTTTAPSRTARTSNPSPSSTYWSTPPAAGRTTRTTRCSSGPTSTATSSSPGFWTITRS